MDPWLRAEAGGGGGAGDVVPELLLTAVFSRYVVPELLPWQQQMDDVVAADAR